MNHNANQEQYKIMTQTRVEKLVLSLAGPTIISMMVTSIYNMADTYFVGKISTEATAAVGVVFSLMAVIQSIGFFFGHGSGNNISRCLGAGEEKRAGEIATYGVVLSCVCGVILMGIGLLFLRPLASALGATRDIMDDTISYMRLILIGAPFIVTAFTMNNQLRFEGKAFYAMVGITSGGLLNIALDPFFIFTLDMGVAGAALATITSQFVSFVILLIGIQTRGIHLHLRDLHLNRENAFAIIGGGTPSLARQGCGSIAMILLNHVAGGFGTAAIAAMSIVSKISMFAASAMIGFGQGFQPVCGYNYGAGRYDRVKRAFWFCVKSSFVVLLILAILGAVFAPELITAFRKDAPDVAAIGTQALRFQCISFPLTGFIVLSNMFSQTIGKSVRATILAIGRQFLFLVPSIYLLTALLGLTGLELSQMCADVCSFLLAVPIVMGLFHEMERADQPIKRHSDDTQQQDGEDDPV